MHALLMKHDFVIDIVSKHIGIVDGTEEEDGGATVTTIHGDC
ncbi:hypothetical protein O9992_12790 [Vibrio lentus]|nr:hypothetical protein [Vibrio lentus]